MAQTTVIPFAQLPPCAAACGLLYDVNGACVPPIKPAVDTNCFCGDPRLSVFSTQANGPCDPACIATPADVTRIQTWYQSFCGVDASVVTETAGSGGSGGSRGNSGGGDWLSNHWKWVIMLVILVVGIAAIWIGACIWRRRYLRRKDRIYELGKHSQSNNTHASWGPGVGSAANIPYGIHTAPAPTTAGTPTRAARSTTSNVSGAGMFVPPTAAPAAVYDEKKPKSTKEKLKEKKKWVVKERT